MEVDHGLSATASRLSQESGNYRMSFLSGTGKSRAARYWKTTRWLFNDILPRYRFDVGLVVVLFVISLGMRLAAFLILSKYIQVLASSSDVHIPFLGVLAARHSYELLAVASLGLLFCFVLSFAAKYVADVSLLRLAGRYEIFCTKRAARTIAAYGDHGRLEKWKALFPKMVGAYPRYCAVTIRLSVRLILPVLTAVVALVGLIYIDRVLTAILIVLTAACAPFLYRISVKAARYSRTLEEQGKDVGWAKREIIVRLADNAKTSGGPLSDELVDEVFSQALPLQESVDNYVGRLKVTEESSFLTGLLMGASIFAILLYKGLEILGAAHGWALIVVYFIVLRVCLGAFMQSANVLTAINRLYPQVSRYSVCVTVIGNLERQGGPAAPLSKVWGGGAVQRKGGAVIEEADDEEVI